MTEIMTTNQTTGGQKGSKAERYDLIPPWPLRMLALVYGQSCKDHGGKYEARNWEKGYAWGLSYAALRRHTDAFWDGEWLDPESGLPHLAHAAWHCFTLMMFHRHCQNLDDRSRLRDVRSK